MSRSNFDRYIHLLLHREQFHQIDWFKSTFRNFRSENVCDRSCSKIVLVRNKRQWSELIAVQDRNFVTKNLKWNCFEFSEKHYFELISLLQLVMRDSLATMLDADVNNSCREKLIAATASCLIIVICIVRCRLAQKWSIKSIINSISLLFFSWSTFAKSTPFLWNNLNLLKFRYVLFVTSQLTLLKRRWYHVSWLTLC